MVHAEWLPMQKLRLTNVSKFFVPSGFAIMTKLKRPFINPLMNAGLHAQRFFNQ